MSKHTPGPLLVCDGEYILIRDSDGNLIASLHDRPSDGPYGRRISKDEAMANARLIAAAPELLEALDALLEWGCIRSDWVSAGFSEPKDHPLNMARRAIAKATGEQQ